jgi:hypothetical protein
LQRVRGHYTVPGPNFLWSIDGYLKLVNYGIEIYAGIDAYSRYITWIYCGVSGKTAVSVLKQYLEILQAGKKQPKFLRSDRGTETVLVANAQLMLAQQQDPSAGIKLEDCYLFGTSTANQRIESWWGQLSKGQLIKWRVNIYLSI